MTYQILGRITLTLTLLGATSSGAMAQERGDTQARGRNPQAAPARNAMEVMNMLDAYALLQAQNALQLPDAQYGDFVTRLKQMQQTRRRNHQSRNRIIQELRKLTNPQVAQVDENAVREQLRLLREHEQRAAVDMRQAYDHLDELLDLRQQARFRIFEEMLERRSLDLLMRARRGAAAGRGSQ